MDPDLTSQLTVVDLLSHRWNFPNAGELAWYSSTTEIRDLVKKLRHVNVSSKLGSKCQHSGVMYGITGEVAINVAEISYERLVETKALEPLKLKNTGSKPMELEKIYPNVPCRLGLEGLLPKRTPNKPTSQKLKVFEGEYTNPVLRDMTVRVEIDGKTEKEALLFKMGPFDRKLEHYHFDSFVGIAKHKNTTAMDLATFRAGRDGKGVVEFQKRRLPSTCFLLAMASELKLGTAELSDPFHTGIGPRLNNSS